METTKKKGMAPSRYDEAFKEGAIRMVTEQGRLSSDVSQELGICPDTLRSCLKKAGIQAGQANRLNREQQKIRELENEIKSLKKQISEKNEVIDILKNLSVFCPNHKG